MSWGVGLLGAGPGVSALHLPTLARHADRFEVAHIADGGSGRAAALAARVGATASSGSATLLGDPRVDVVAICSPPEQHAAQALAAVAAGKRAILCEKPLALTAADADAVVDACRAAGVALVVGTNHLFDPAWGRAEHHLVAERGQIQTVSVLAALPPNDRYHDVVTEPLPAAVPTPRPQPDLADPSVAAGLVARLLLGLGVHDVPLLRDLAPRIDEVVYARAIAPIGYTVGYLAGGVLVQVSAVMLPGATSADALWRLTIGTSLDELEVEFRPAFTHDGSAAVRVRSADGRIVEHPRDPGDGYVQEWAAVAAALDGRSPVEYDDVRADAHYAIALAEGAAARIRTAATS
ncbi:Gfo/Idh/MocA family oxidoreductase [Microbacterium sp.]|uniref:Gfo/Idh/MocA family oxidoreductase n=1 Tax=Microbacterium sp. TaxID=51671 RepID=UPI0039E3E760